MKKNVKVWTLFLCAVMLFAVAGCPREPALEDLEPWLKDAAFEEVIISKSAMTLIARMTDEQKKAIVTTLSSYPEFVESLDDYEKENFYRGLSDGGKEMIFDELVREKVNAEFIINMLNLPDNEELRSNIKEYFVSELSAEELLQMLDEESREAVFYKVTEGKTKEQLWELADGKDTEIPDAVTGFKALALDRGAVLVWEDSASEDVFAYEISFSEEIGGARSLASSIDRDALLVQPGIEFARIDGLANGGTYQFSIRTVDFNGNKSEKSTVYRKIGSDFEMLGKYEVLNDSELGSYGISESSVPPRIAGATYVKFGAYPQSVKKDDVKIFENIVNTEISGATYYFGSDGSWYAKCRENRAPSELNPRYSYSDGTAVKDLAEGSIRYFKVEPVIWRKLGGDGYLYAERILASGIDYYGGEEERTLGGKTIYPNNYRYSNMRAWLNGTDSQFVSDGGTRTDYDLDWSGKGFLQQAFTAAQQAKILVTEVDNSGETTTDGGLAQKADGTAVDSEGNHYPDMTCENTLDKVFILSTSEVMNTANGFETRYPNGCGRGHTRARVPTDYALANGSSIFEDQFLGGASWLRSPFYTDTAGQMEVSFDDGVGMTSTGMWIMGITPALKVVQN